MKDHLKNYDDGLKKESEQFFFLCDVPDVRTILTRYKKEKMDDFVRLSCVAIILGYKKVFLRLFKEVEKDEKEFIAKFEKVDRDFGKIDCWMNDFIKKVKCPEARELTREYWEERKQGINHKEHIIKQLL